MNESDNAFEKVAFPIIRPATRADIEAFSDMPGKPTIKAIVGDLDGRIIGIGGVALIAGRWIAFCDLTPDARKYKMTLARAAIRFIRDLKEQGVKFIYAEADTKNEPRAVEWIRSLGFELDPRSGINYRWKA